MRTETSRLWLQSSFTSHMAPCNCKWWVAYSCMSKHTSNHSRSVQLETIFWRASHPNWPMGTAFSTLTNSPWSPTEGFVEECQRNCLELLKSRSMMLAWCEHFFTGTWKRMYITTGTKEAITSLCNGPSYKNPGVFGYIKCMCQNHSICRTVGDIEFPLFTQLMLHNSTHTSWKWNHLIS